MNIGVDATCWQNQRGYGRHARALLSALVRLDRDNHYTFFLDSDENLETLPSEAQVIRVASKVPAALAASATGHRSIRDMARMSRAMSDRRLDIVFFPTIYSYVPVFSRAKKIVLIQDIIADKYQELTLPSRTGRFFWNLKVALGRWQADAIGTVSEYSRRAIAGHFKIPPDRIFVVGEASDPVFHVLPNPRLSPRLQDLGISAGNRLVVYVGGFAPHKNLEALVTSFASIIASPSFSDVRLVLVGENQNEVFHSYSGIIKKMVVELGIQDRVIFTGYLPDDQVVILLNCSTVLVLPSLMEGFGLPAVEAAACGCPVIATVESPLPDLLGEGGLYVNPRKRGELMDALTRVLESAELRERMRTAGLAAAGRLTWDAAALQMKAVFQKVSAQ